MRGPTCGPFIQAYMCRPFLCFDFADEASFVRLTGSVVPHPPEVPVQPGAMFLTVAVVRFSAVPFRTEDTLSGAVPPPDAFHLDVGSIRPKVTIAQFYNIIPFYH